MQPQVSTLTLSDYLLRQQRFPALSKAVVLLLMCCVLIPRGVELQIKTIMIDASRILLLLFGLMALGQLISGSVKLRGTFADLLMAVHVTLICLSGIYHEGLGNGWEITVGTFVDVGLAYIVARVFVRNLVSYRYYVKILLVIAAGSAIFGLTEMFTGYSIIRAAYHTVFPKVPYVYLHAQRLSLYRATTTFRAEILFGLYCMTIFCLAVYIRPRDLKMSTGLHKACLILCILGVFSSLASGPWLGLALSLFCLGYDRISKGVRGRWKLLVLGLALVVLLLSIASNRGPIKLVIHYLTLSPETGHIRIAMWECIWALIPDYWLLGWGWTGEWPRAVEWYVWDSVDSFYGVLFIHAGIFAVLSIVAFLASSWYRLSKSSFGQDLSKTEGKGWILGTVCLFLTAITVHIFGNLIFATYFLLGAGQALISTPKPMVFSDSLACRDTHPKELMVDSAF